MDKKQKQSRYSEIYTPECIECGEPIPNQPKGTSITDYKCDKHKNNMEKILLENGFKLYKHKGGFTAWSKTNLLEYSDEWELA
jgi:hypothetical protein